jgi:hypothetical protein
MPGLDGVRGFPTHTVVGRLATGGASDSSSQEKRIFLLIPARAPTNVVAMASEHQIDRRGFLVTGSAAAAMATGLVAAGGAEGAGPVEKPAVKKKQVIGIQIGSISFLDEGVEKVLDILQERAAVNTLFVATFTYGHGIAGRQVAGHPFPDHGVKDYNDKFRGGNYATPHPKYYQNTVFKNLKAPDDGNQDVLELVIPAAKKRGMKTYTWSEDVWRSDVPGIEKALAVDFHGQKATDTVCLNNPEYFNFLLGLHEDFTRSYDIDGVMWGCEKQGAFNNAFESIHNSNGNDPGRVTCFCSFCQAKGKKRGINFERVKEGFQTLETWVRAAKANQRPPDGYWVTFWRILYRYPELLAWETLWHDSLRDAKRAIYQLVKSIKPQVQVGWHEWHAHGFSPFFRAQLDLKELSPYSDFLKMTVYHNLGGVRMATYMDSVTKTILHDFPMNEALAHEYRIMNYQERPYEQLPHTGMSSDYVYRETRRCVEAVSGTRTEIWPGIDMGIPIREDYSKVTPQGVKDCIVAAYRGGAQGLVLSRKYSETTLANLTAAGQALRELKVV